MNTYLPTYLPYTYTYIHTYIKISQKMQKRKDIRNFYVTEEFIPIWEQFREICQREGGRKMKETPSAKIREFVTHYVQAHSHGNPQTLLETFGSEPTLICNYCGKGGFKTLRKVTTPGGIMSVCPSCYKDLKFRRLIKK